MDYITMWNMLVSGGYIEASILPYTMLLGSAFYGILALTALTMVYLKTEDFGTTGIIMLLLVAGAVPLMPAELGYIARTAVALAMVAVLYKMYKG